MSHKVFGKMEGLNAILPANAKDAGGWLDGPAAIWTLPVLLLFLNVGSIAASCEIALEIERYGFRLNTDWPIILIILQFLFTGTVIIQTGMQYVLYIGVLQICLNLGLVLWYLLNCRGSLCTILMVKWSAWLVPQCVGAVALLGAVRGSLVSVVAILVESGALYRSLTTYSDPAFPTYVMIILSQISVAGALFLLGALREHYARRLSQVQSDLLHQEQIGEMDRERIRTQQALTRANRSVVIGAITGSIAHQINQPLAATVTNVNAALHWLAGGDPDGKRARLAMERAVEEGHRASEVVRGLRDLLGREPAKSESISMSQLVQHTIALARGEFDLKGIRLDAQLDWTLPHVRGEPLQLQQVILNILINAIEAFDGWEGAKHINVSIEHIAAEQRIQLAISDTGPGLPDRISGPFYTTKPAGMGMGLTICLTIVEAHLGTFEIEALAHGGTQVRVSLPSEH